MFWQLKYLAIANSLHDYVADGTATGLDCSGIDGLTQKWCMLILPSDGAWRVSWL